MTTDISSIPSSPIADQVDVRGPRFAAWITTAVLIIALASSAFSTAAAAAILAVQAAVFAVGARYGPRRHPYGVIFSRVVAPRLGPPTEREPVEPLRFAQLVGVVFAVTGAAAFAAGAPVFGAVAAALALAAAFLNAAFGICLGCQVYPLAARLRRIERRGTAAIHSTRGALLRDPARRGGRRDYLVRGVRGLPADH